MTGLIKFGAHKAKEGSGWVGYYALFSHSGKPVFVKLDATETRNQAMQEAEKMAIAGYTQLKEQAGDNL